MADSVTLHCADAGEVSDCGVHDKPLKDGGAVLMVIVPPEPAAAKPSPIAEEALTFVTLTALDVEVVFPATVNVAVATTPSAMTV